jgi:hypothetical protein
MSGCGRYCCKSPKLPGDDFPPVSRSDRRTPICAASITLPRSPVSLSVGDEVPHIYTRKSRLQPGEFLITNAKRLLQHNRHESDLPKRLLFGRSRRQSGRANDRRYPTLHPALRPAFTVRRGKRSPCEAMRSYIEYIRRGTSVRLHA